MSKATPSDEILGRHLKLLEELHATFLEEGTLLRSDGGVPNEAFLERKRAFLNRLDNSLAELRSLGGGQAELEPATAIRVREARNRLLQILMLDRENERMLLKATVTKTIQKQFAPVLPGRVAKAYGGSPPGAQKEKGSQKSAPGSGDPIKF